MPTDGKQLGHAGLRARERECAVLDKLLAEVRHGVSRCLVLRGEAGMGKTALLRYLIDFAADTTVLWAIGVGRRWSWRTPVCTRCVRRCSAGSTGCRLRSVRP